MCSWSDQWSSPNLTSTNGTVQNLDAQQDHGLDSGLNNGLNTWTRILIARGQRLCQITQQ